MCVLFGHGSGSLGLGRSHFVWIVFQCPVFRGRGHGGLLESDDSPHRLRKTQLGSPLLFLRCMECNGKAHAYKYQNRG